MCTCDDIQALWHGRDNLRGFRHVVCRFSRSCPSSGHRLLLSGSRRCYGSRQSLFACQHTGPMTLVPLSLYRPWLRKWLSSSRVACVEPDKVHCMHLCGRSGVCSSIVLLLGCKTKETPSFLNVCTDHVSSFSLAAFVANLDSFRIIISVISWASLKFPDSSVYRVDYYCFYCLLRPYVKCEATV